jgi:Tfp pilus assembly protein PilN
VAIAQYFRYSALQTESARLDEEIQTLQREKAELAQVQSQYETFSRRKELLTARINVIEQLKEQQSGPGLLLSTLVNSVSGTEAIWLTGFEKTGQQVNITGVALNMRAVADLITRLMNTNTFAELDLRETAQDTATDFERFNFTLEAQLAQPAVASSSGPRPGAS